MAKQPDKKNGVGRPKSYSPELVHTIIGQSIRGGIPVAEIDAAFVKEQLCRHHGVSDGIRIESLKELVALTLEDFAGRERQALLRGLPDSVAPAVEEVVAATGRELLLLVARQNAACMAAAERECQELRADKRNANWRIAELESALKELEGETRKLTEERDAATEQLTDAHAQLRTAQAEVNHLKGHTGTVDRLLAELRNPAVRDDIRAVLTDIVAKPATEHRAS